jgi:hypothetical protein
MFKKMMSDFAFNRVLEKHRKLSKVSYTQNNTVIASLLETEAKQYYSGVQAQKLRSFLTECVNRAKTQEGNTFDVNEHEDFMCIVYASVHSMFENDTDQDFYKEDMNNQIKILVNLKLLPERFLQIEIRDPEECVA